MTTAMTVTTKVSCAVRIPAGKAATAVRLFVEEQARTWWCLKKTIFAPILDIKLDKERRHKVSDTHFEYPDCRVKVNLDKLKELHPDCCVKLKVKRGELTIRKKIVDAKDLIHCLQEPSDVFGKIHVTLDVSSFYPLTVALEIHAKKTQNHENKPDMAEVEAAVGEACSDESLQAVSETITDQPPQPVPVAYWESLMMENTTEAETDDELEDISLSDDAHDEGELSQDGGHESEKYPLQQDLSCFKGLGVDEEQTKLPIDEPAPVRRSVWVGMWRPVRRVVLLSVLGVLAVTALLVVLEPMLPDLDDDEA